MKCWRCAALLSIVQVVTGAVLTAVAIHAAFTVPSLSVRHFPLWASVPLLLSGLISSVLVFGCKNKHSAKKSVFSFKVACFVALPVSVLTSTIASVFLSVHVFLYVDRYSSCSPSGGDCVCRKDGQLYDQLFPYRDTDCRTVLSSMRALMLVMSVLGAAGGLSASWFLSILWSSHYHHVYAGVSLDDVSVV
ncbi:uncharacterized protein LOC111636058 isoform X2 [Centruroides sculpturatus]|nr:uncharacterized protein LOC111636058 isoform X2 [Centruroides sculpturatus]XP_023236987.1 uncharacterized protein LOC111636058 isoform X2 [Centruroides sculpturatus]